MPTVPAPDFIRGLSFSVTVVNRWRWDLVVRMNLPEKILLALLSAALPALTSCGLVPEPNPDQKKILKAQWVNPHPAVSYTHLTLPTKVTV